MALVALTAARSELAPGATDLRGWEARTLVDDRAVGRIRDLLLDEEGQVRWLALELTGARCVLLPAGQARADRERRRVWLPGLATDQLALLPDYDPTAGPPDPAREERLLDAYGAALQRERAAPAAPLPAGDVVPLSSLPGYRVAAGEDDPRGWTVRDAEDEPVGEVTELLVDPGILRVRHLVCRVDGAGGRHVLLPIAYASLDPGRSAVRIARLTRAALAALPDWVEDGPPVRDAAAAAAVRLGAARAPGADPRLDPTTLFGEEAA